MKRNYPQLLVILFAITLFLSNCGKKGDPGAQGPAGENGATGATGPQGPAGSQGAKGDAGTANVIYSDWLDVAFVPDTVHNGSVIDTLGFIGGISAPKIDANMLSQGEMKVYINFGTSTDPFIYPLPYVDIIFGGVSISPAFYLQNIDLYANADASTVTRSGSKYYQYRYILIPGGTKAARKMVDLNNYNEVKKFYGLRD